MGRRKAQTIEPPPPVVEPEVSEPEPPSPEPAPALPPPPFPSFVPRQRVIPPAVRAAAKRKLQRIQRQDQLAKYQNNPVGYAHDILHVKLTREQEEILRSVATNRRTAVMASHGVGKTFAASICANWWFDCWPAHICYITAPTWDSAKGLTFAQAKMLRQKADLPGKIMETGWVKDEDKNADPVHYIRTLNAEKGEAFQGEHKAPVMVLVEEAPGVPGYIIESADKGLMTGPTNRMLLIGNPTDEATPFGEACSNPAYHTLSISALTHPNILADLSCRTRPFPENDIGLLWLKEALEDDCTVENDLTGDAFSFWSIPTILAALGGVGVERNPDAERWIYHPNARFQGRVLGRFPSQLYEQVIPKNWLLDLPKGLPIAGIPQIGADIARHGDDRTCIVARFGPVVTEARILRKMDLAVVTGAIKDVARDAGRLVGVDPRAIPIRVDVTGGLGAGPYDFLVEAGYRLADAVNASQTAFDPEKFINRRSELWFAAQDRIRTRDLDLSRLPPDTRAILIRELSTPKWKPDSRGRKVVEDKAITKGRLGWSPDVGDAFNLAFSPSAPQPAETEFDDDPFGYEDERL